MPKSKTLIVLAQSLEQPRIIKRIIEKSDEYKSVNVYGFNRKIHAVNNYSILTEYPNVSLNIVGSFSNRKYLNRLATYLKLLVLLYREHGFKKKYLYVFGIDLRLLSSFLMNSVVHYEISDIMWLYAPKRQKRILQALDNVLVKNSDKVIFTSQGFYDVYYKNYKPEEDIIIKENKFKSYGKVNPIKDLKTDYIRIAYIGAFRYKNIIENLIKAVGENDNVILNFYGDGDKNVVKNIEDGCKEHTNIFYHGPFKNPDDLERIYAENNLNFVVYDNTLANEKVAMPNKFYESGFLNVPIVCAVNTYVGQRVLDQSMGWTIGISHQEISAFLSKITMEEIVRFHKNIKNLDKEQFHC